ncbi:MAG: SAM-dependent methyltransferase [Robiginitomaculum sp.]
MPQSKPLKERIIEHIAANGPMSIGRYMAWCLLDPKQGYYPTRDPLGVDGDFITAPEISQMFGEVLGLWLIGAWRSMGSPKKIQLVEYGPGRGVMMADILRAAMLDKDFISALNVTLIEPSAALEAKQGENLASTSVPINWADRLEDVPKGPTLIIGNEYLDCLPIRQFVMIDRFKGVGGFHERFVDIPASKTWKLCYSYAKKPISAPDIKLLPQDLADFKDDDILEVSLGLAQIVDSINARFNDAPGAALFIDYGHEQTEYGDTFQAIHKHTKVYPLDDPGEADLTARVDFSYLKQMAKAAGLSVYGPCPQGTFLSRLGIEVRAVALSKAVPKSKEKIARQLLRLTDSEQMGELFKAITLQSNNLPVPLGFKA